MGYALEVPIRALATIRVAHETHRAIVSSIEDRHDLPTP